MNEVKHPAKYTDIFLPIFAEKLSGKRNVLDIFAGTCKISEIKNFGFDGKIYCNEIEPEWGMMGLESVDSLNIGDAEFLPYKSNYFEAICTSPTYGNRMADHFDSRDGSKRITYRHMLGRDLDKENTGRMQWGKKYRDKHDRIWREAHRVLVDDGILILNVKNHIRKGKEVDVIGWHKNSLINNNFSLVEEINIPVRNMGFGANSEKRTNQETILVFKKDSYVEVTE